MDVWSVDCNLNPPQIGRSESTRKLYSIIIFLLYRDYRMSKIILFLLHVTTDDTHTLETTSLLFTGVTSRVSMTTKNSLTAVPYPAINTQDLYGPRSCRAGWQIRSSDSLVRHTTGARNGRDVVFHTSQSKLLTRAKNVARITDSHVVSR